MRNKVGGSYDELESFVKTISGGSPYRGSERNLSSRGARAKKMGCGSTTSQSLCRLQLSAAALCDLSAPAVQLPNLYIRLSANLLRQPVLQLRLFTAVRCHPVLLVPLFSTVLCQPVYLLMGQSHIFL